MLTPNLVAVVGLFVRRKALHVINDSKSSLSAFFTTAPGRAGCARLDADRTFLLVCLFVTRTFFTDYTDVNRVSRWMFNRLG